MSLLLYSDWLTVKPVDYLVDLCENVDIEHEQEGEDAHNESNFSWIQRCNISIG